MKRIFLLLALLLVAERQARPQEKLKADGEMPIVAWFGIPEHAM